ncbi:MAG: hypothetical protein KatS3mg059_1078 [Thermomicrobiales bacterium]|nr:MAG: hypothetical protein KatS3mg059_1078 [Thermomicrobiales bacterium]
MVVLVHAPGARTPVAALLQRAGAQRVIPVAEERAGGRFAVVPPAWTGRYELRDLRAKDDRPE